MMYLKRFYGLVFFLLMALPFSAQADGYRHHQVFVYILARFIEWPEASQEGDFVVGVVGDSPAEDSFRRMAMVRKLGDRRVRVKHIYNLESAKECDIVFLANSSSEKFDLLREKIDRLPVLLVTERPGYAEKGSAINFIRKNGRLRMEMNKSALERASLTPTPNLLKFVILV